MLGNGRLEAMCFDGVKRLCHIRGKLRKKVSSSGWGRGCCPLQGALVGGVYVLSPHSYTAFTGQRASCESAWKASSPCYWAFI